MIIKCEQCQTKFRLDDSKVTDKGVKVRCAKCKHVFTVQNELPKTEQPEQSEFSSFLESAADQPRPEGTLIAGTESDATVPMPPFLYDSNNSDADATAAGTLQFESVPSDTPSDAFLNDSLPDPERSDVPFSFDSAAGESESSAGSELSPAMPEESGFGGFDSGENVTEDGQL